MSIPFIRGYPNPDSPGGFRRGLTTINRPAAVEYTADRFILAGGRYLCEIGKDAQAHLMAVTEINGKAELVAEERCTNGPDLLRAVDRLVAESAKHIAASAS